MTLTSLGSFWRRCSFCRETSIRLTRVEDSDLEVEVFLGLAKAKGFLLLVVVMVLLAWSSSEFCDVAGKENGFEGDVLE